MDGDWAASTLKWWHDAGVDTIVGETPRDWLAAEKKVSPATPQPRAASGVSLPERKRELALPVTLADFQAWLLAGDLALASASSGRVGPAGDPASGLMVLIDMPSAADV